MPIRSSLSDIKAAGCKDSARIPHLWYSREAVPQVAASLCIAPQRSEAQFSICAQRSIVCGVAVFAQSYQFIPESSKRRRFDIYLADNHFCNKYIVRMELWAALPLLAVFILAVATLELALGGAFSWQL